MQYTLVVKCIFRKVGFEVSQGKSKSGLLFLLFPRHVSTDTFPPTLAVVGLAQRTKERAAPGSSFPISCNSLLSSFIKEMIFLVLTKPYRRSSFSERLDSFQKATSFEDLRRRS